MKSYKKGDIIVFKYFPLSSHVEPCKKVGKIIMAFDFLDCPSNYMVIDEMITNEMYSVWHSHIIRKATQEEIFKFLMEE